MKAAKLSRLLRETAREVLIHTGQHYDDEMSAVFFRQLRIPDPDYNLGVGSGPHGEQTGEMLKRLEPVLLDERPECVVVYGDTNSTLAGALAASKLHIPVAHVEAGLRSFNRAMPEEINRIMADHLASFLFAPSDAAVENLRREGIDEGVYQCGDVMYDAVLEHARIAEATSDILSRLRLEDRDFAVVTIHRAENTDDPKRLAAILEALERVSRDIPLVFPVHPRTRKAMDLLSLNLPEGATVTGPLPYLDMILLESRARFILTDSGGVQKEALFFAVPCITVRGETEWVETLEGGWNALVGADPAEIVEATRHARPGKAGFYPYGSGDACRSIVDALTRHLGREKEDAAPLRLTSKAQGHWEGAPASGQANAIKLSV